MKTVYRKSSQSLIPPYSENAALQLIVVSGVTFIAFHFARIFMFLVGKEKAEVFQAMFPNFGLSTLDSFFTKPWLALTYGWIHHGFFAWVSNMIWAYCFASVLQSLAGYRQVIPLFAYALVVGGLAYVGIQYIDKPLFHPTGNYFLGAQAGVIALGAASLTLAPRYRLNFAPNLGVPLALLVLIHVVLDVVVYLPGNINALILCAGGFATGVVFSLFLKKGYRPAAWIYDVFDKLQVIATPKDKELREKKSRKRVEILRSMYEPKKGISQDKIDELLDKINEQGYHSLSREEKDVLLRASKE